MLFKTKGIVFRFVKYRDTSIIVNIFTELFGLQSYIVNSVRSKSSKSKIALFQPLTCLDLVVYHRESADINRISEIKCSSPLVSIPIDIRKSSVALFLTEILHKTIREKNEVTPLFTFLDQSIQILDHLDNNVENFHLQFLLKLTQYLGLEASQNELKLIIPINVEELELIDLLKEKAYNHHFKISKELRQQILQHTLLFYRNHYDSLSHVKSLDVLHAVLND